DRTRRPGAAAGGRQSHRSGSGSGRRQAGSDRFAYPGDGGQPGISIARGLPMKRASIIAKQGKPELGQVARQVVRWLRDHGYTVAADGAAGEFCPECRRVEREQLAETHPDFVVVLGGDGTLLSAARNVAEANIPILGVNLGSLGFLTEIKQDEIAQALADIDDGRHELAKRSMVHCQVRREGQCVATYDALNDIVMNQQAVARITEFEVR